MKKALTTVLSIHMAIQLVFATISFSSETADSPQSARQNSDNVYLNRFISMQKDQIHQYIENFDMSMDEAPRQVAALLHHPDNRIKRKALSSLCRDSSPEIVSSLSDLLMNPKETLEIRFEAVDILMQLQPVAAIRDLSKLMTEKPENPVISLIASRKTSLIDEISAYSTVESYLTCIIDGQPVEAYSFLGPKLERRATPYNLEGCISPYYKRFIIHDIKVVNSKHLVTVLVFVEWSGSGELGFRKDMFTVEKTGTKHRITARKKGTYIKFD